MSKNAGNSPGKGPGSGTGSIGSATMGPVAADVVVGEEATDPPPVATTVIGPVPPNALSFTPVVSMNTDMSPVIWVRPRFSACWTTFWGIENWVWRSLSWKSWFSARVDGVIVAVVVVSLSTRSPTGLPGQYSS